MESYDFDDVLLLPVPSEVDSRELVNISFKSTLLHLDFPVIASPMANIVNTEFAIELAHLGGLAILHRFKNRTDRFRDIDIVRSEINNFGVAIGLSDDDLDIAEYAVKSGARIICVDVANGYTKTLREFIAEKVLPITKNQALLMSGNVATESGFYNLTKVGVDIVRVGIGSGALCTTRNKTGVGVPQITAINNCFNNGNHEGYLLADGGIRNSGDAVKAFAFGADLVMLGTAFAATNESAHNGHIYGMASREMQEQFYGRVKSVEGLSKPAEKSISLRDFVLDFKYSLKSACTYLNCINLSDIKYNVKYIKSGSGSIKQLEK